MARTAVLEVESFSVALPKKGGSAPDHLFTCRLNLDGRKIVVLIEVGWVMPICYQYNDSACNQ